MSDLAAVPQPGDPIARLLAAYLDGRRSPNTADTYRRDITH